MKQQNNQNYTGMELYDKVIKPSKDVKFACVINNHGKILCAFNENYLNIDSKKKEMLFMEAALQARMNKDFDGELGEFRCNVTERDNGYKCISAPLPLDKTVFAVMDRNKDHSSFVNNAMRMAWNR